MTNERYRAVCIQCDYKSGWYYMEKSAQRADDNHSMTYNHTCGIEVQDEQESK